MKNLDYFKKQAKYLVKDWETRKVNPGTDEDWEGEPYVYDGEHFEMLSIVNFFGVDDDFGLQKAQHIIAQMAGFKKWDDLQNADEDELALAKIRFLHLDPTDEEIWDRYCRKIGWDHSPFEARFPLIKDEMYNKKNDFLKSNQFVDEKLYGKEREIALQKQLNKIPFISDPETTVRCIHCGQSFKSKELLVVHEYGFTSYSERDFAVCKNYPKCDGTLIDMMREYDSDGE